MDSWKNELNFDKDKNSAKAHENRERFDKNTESLQIYASIKSEADFMQYQAWLEAGFSKDQAFQLLLKTK